MTMILYERMFYILVGITSFLDRWKRDYLTNLREQHSLENSKPISAAKGEVVHCCMITTLKEDNGRLESLKG